MPIRSRRLTRDVYGEIERAPQGAVISVASRKDADFWSDIARSDYGRRDIAFSFPGGVVTDAPAPTVSTAHQGGVVTAINGQTTSTTIAAISSGNEAVVPKALYEQLTRGLELSERKLRGANEEARMLKREADAAREAQTKLSPIEDVPHDREVMVYCPGEKPEHVAVIWRQGFADGELAWEGLCFVDDLLCDLCPEGPVNATHWYEAPRPPIFIGNIHPNEDPARSTDPWDNVDAADGLAYAYTNRLTPAQLAAVRSEGITPQSLEIHQVEISQWCDILDLHSRDDPFLAVNTRVVSETVECPIIWRDNFLRVMRIVREDGSIQEISW